MNSAHRYSCYSIEVTSESANTAPVVSTSAAITYYDRDPATAIATDLTVTDSDSANMASAVVSITGNFSSSQDTLGFTNQNGITGSYNSGTGVLTLSGSATKANYQTALRSVTYANSSHTPTNNTRTISFKVNDGTVDSATDTATVTVTTIGGSSNLITTAGAGSTTVPAYHALEIEIWAGGQGGDNYYNHGNLGLLTTCSTFGLTANPATISFGQGGRYWGYLSGLPGSSSGGDINLPGQRGGNGGKYRQGGPTGEGLVAVEAPVQGGNAPFGGLGGTPPVAGIGFHAGHDGAAPGGGGSGTVATGYGLAWGGFYSEGNAGGTAGSYCKKRFVRGAVGAPAIGSTINFNIGAGGAAIVGNRTGALSTYAGAGANGGIRVTALSFESLTPGEGGDTPPAPPVDLGVGTVTITGEAQSGSTLTAIFDGDDPDDSAGYLGADLAYHWFRDGVAVTGATGKNYFLGAADVGHVMSASIDYTDFKGFRDTAVSADTDTVLRAPRPLDYMISGEIWACYGLRLLRSDYTGPLFTLQHGNGVSVILLDVYPEADGEVDYDAIEAWRVANGTEFSPTRYETWYNQFDNVSRARDLKGHLIATANMPEYATQNALPERLPGGAVAIRFDGFEQFRIATIAGPANNLGFLAVVERNNSLPGEIFKWDYVGSEDTLNPVFQITASAAQDWQANAAVFYGHGYLLTRGPRAIANIDEPTDNTDDAVIWDGELNATRVGIRRNGSTQPLLINNHSSYTQPSAAGDLCVGPKTFVTGKHSLMSEFVIFGTDVRGSIGRYRTDVALSFIIGSVDNATADDLSVDFSDDEGLQAIVAINFSLAVAFTDDNGLTATIQIDPAKLAHFVDEDGLSATVTIRLEDRPPASQLFVICIGT
jgi:hypothetical protein